MAIRTQQSEVSFILGPIFESARPVVRTIFWSNFPLRVNMIYIKGTVIAKTALRAFAAEFFNQRQFSFPIARTLVDSMAVQIPICLEACIGTKAGRTFIAALFALPRFCPSVRKIARSIAVFACPIAESIGVHLSLFPAMGAFNRFCRSSHGIMIARYFDIACRRIEDAQRQQRMFA